MAQINGSCSLGRNYGFYITVEVSGSYPNATAHVRSYVTNGDKRFNSNNWWFECTVNGVTKRSGRGINIATNYTNYWATCGPLTYGTDAGSGTSTVFSFPGVPAGNVSVSYRIYKSTSYSSYDPGEMRASGTFAVGSETRNVVVRIAEQDCYGNYQGSWVWINTNVNYGTAVDYWGYGNASGPDNIYYNPVHYANSSVTSNIDTTVYATRRTYGFDLNIYDPNGNQPWNTGAAGYVDFSTDSGTSWAHICNEQASSYPISRPLRIGTIYPGTGMHLNRVAAKNADTGAETNLSPSSGIYAYDQPANTLHLNVYMSWNNYTLTCNPNGGVLVGGNFGSNAGTTNNGVVTTTYTSPNYSTLGTASKANTTATRTVTFNANGGTCSTTSLNSTATVSYPFKGWYTATSGGTQVFSSGGVCIPGTAYWDSNSKWCYLGNLTIYAQYGSNTSAYSAITLPTATRKGYNFLGWSTSSTATTGITGSYTPSANTTLYAVWEKATAEVNVKVGNAWKKGAVSVKVNNAWVDAKEIYVNVNGTWKKAA